MTDRGGVEGPYGAGPRPAAPGHEPALSPSQEARPLLGGALAQADAAHGDSHPAGPGCGSPRSGGAGVRAATRSGPPDGLIRLRFADVRTLERAGAAFGAASGPGLGDAWSDPAALILRIHGTAGVETLRAVLAVLDAAALTAESLTVHTRELDDVLAVFAGLP